MPQTAASTTGPWAWFLNTVVTKGDGAVLGLGLGDPRASLVPRKEGTAHRVAKTGQRDRGLGKQLPGRWVS